MSVYLDHAATTPMHPDVLSAYAGALGLIGNPSSIHTHGRAVRRLLEDGRESVAAALGADRLDVVFTSGGTESVNLGIKGLFWSRRTAVRDRILVSRAEHHATIDTVEWLERHEAAVIDWIGVDALGRVDVAELASRMGDDVALVTTLVANNEVGTVQPVDEIIRIAADAGVPVHLDAVSAWGHLPLDFTASGADAMSVSAHKIGGPPGIGALLVSRRSAIEPLVHGGGQQRGIRSGTQDAAAAMAFGVAAGLIAADTGRHRSLERLRDRIIDGVLGSMPTAVLRGDPVDRLDNNAHFTFPGCEGDSLLMLLDAAGISVSTGSACQAGVPEPSHVLLAMGHGAPEARAALRMTVGATSSDRDVDELLSVLPGVVERAQRAGLSTRRVGAVSG